jgi:hypothetical protein
MKTNKSLFFQIPVIASLILIPGCVLILPFYGITERTNESFETQVRYLNSIKIDTSSLYNLDCAYYDSINMEKYAVNLYKLEHGANASVVQFRLYEPDGKLVTAWEQCLGNARRLGFFDEVPMKPGFDNIPVNYNLSFQSDLNMFDIDSLTREEILQVSKEFDYTLILFWAEFAGVFTTRMFRDVYGYIEKDTTNSYLVLKLNTAKICQ